VNARDDSLNTALHYVFMPSQENSDYYLSDKVALLKKLVDMGADVNAQNAELDTPLHLAAKHGMGNLAGVLVHLGADPMIKNKKKKNVEYWAEHWGHFHAFDNLALRYDENGEQLLDMASDEIAASQEEVKTSRKRKKNTLDDDFVAEGEDSDDDEIEEEETEKPKPKRRRRGSQDDDYDYTG
jgi:Ankyrin repeats (many copies)